ncbi:MAG TPA: hypothetical protein DF603_02945 [Chryseobacterium sp.]|nr:hypothetical protein [Chryseobacterium sp.]
MKEKFQISSPYSQDWESMEQVFEGRFCDECKKRYGISIIFLKQKLIRFYKAISLFVQKKHI